MQNSLFLSYLASSFFNVVLLSLFALYMQDGEVWTFSVRAFDSGLPERTINVNYEGFAEGCYL